MLPEEVWLERNHQYSMSPGMRLVISHGENLMDPYSSYKAKERGG